VMLPPVFQTLKTSTAVKNIVGQNPPRIYRHGSAPQDTTRPYLTWYVVSGIPENHLSGTPPVDRVTVQVDCWHQTDSGIEALAIAVRDVIEPVAHMTNLTVNERETETKLYRLGLQFDWWLGRPDAST
jgi:hypothetical protein